jgi:hypothetical protein
MDGGQAQEAGGEKHGRAGMSDLRIDYSDLGGLVEEGRKAWARAEVRKGGVRRLPFTVGRWTLVLALLAILPFMVLIRGGVFAYRVWGLGTWPSLTVAVVATALVLGTYAWFFGRRIGAGEGARRILTRGAMALGIAYVGYALVYVASSNVKSDEVKAEYSTVHPLLRIATSALILADPAMVLTDAGRTPEDYWLMGLPRTEASLHFEQTDGWVHALDLRTNDRPEWRNRAVELAFWALGFHSLRHVGTADHLHVSLRPPA